MNELKIIITGSSGSGKSTMSRLLTELLTSGGFDVSNEDMDEIIFPVDSDRQANRICSLLDKDTKISIDSQQEKREFYVKTIIVTPDNEIKEV